MAVVHIRDIKDTCIKMELNVGIVILIFYPVEFGKKIYLSDSGNHSLAKCHKAKCCYLTSNIKCSGITFSIKASLLGL